MEPGYADGWVNVGRARLTEGNLAGAEEALRQALEPSTPASRRRTSSSGPRSSRRAATTRRSRHLRHAAALYPRDRVVRNQVGRLLFLKRQYREAIAELAAGPRDRSRGPAGTLQSDARLPGGRRQRDGEEARGLYRRFKVDESAQTITGPYRQLHPHDNNERQAVHEHASGPLPTATAPAYASPRAAAAGPAPRAGAAARPASAHAASPARAAAAGAGSEGPPSRRRRARRRASRGAAARARAPAVGRRDPVRRRDRRRADHVPPQLGRLRQEVPAGDDGLGPRPLRLRQRRLARRLLRERHALARPARRARATRRSTTTTATARSPT